MAEKSYSTPTPKEVLNLTVRPLQDNEQERPFPQFARPQPVGYFSMGPIRDYRPNAAELRYLKLPRLPINLNKNINKAKHKPESAYDERVDNLLTFLVQLQQSQPTSRRQSTAPLNIDIACWRGLLRRIMCAPYERSEDFCVHATHYMGTIYLHEPDTEEKKARRRKEKGRLRDLATHGFMFEQHCLVESPFQQARTDRPVDMCSEFDVVFQTKIGGLEILYGAEMDGIISPEPVTKDNQLTVEELQKLKFIELKVTMERTTENRENSYRRYKTRNWWCQSFLVGIEDVYVGLRDERDHVRKIEHLKVNDLRRQGQNVWKSDVCANFLIDFLRHMKSLMSDISCPHTVYEFYYNAHKGIITYSRIGGVSPHSFLPDWYITFVKKLSADVADELNLSREKV